MRAALAGDVEYDSGEYGDHDRSGKTLQDRFHLTLFDPVREARAGFPDATHCRPVFVPRQSPASRPLPAPPSFMTRLAGGAILGRSE